MKESMVSIVVSLVGDKLEVTCEAGVDSQKVEAPMLMTSSIQAISFSYLFTALLKKENVLLTGCEVKGVKGTEKGHDECKSGEVVGPFTFSWADGWESPAIGKVTAVGAGPIGFGTPKIAEAASQKALTFSNQDHALTLSWEKNISKLVLPYSDADLGEKITFSTNGKNTKIAVKKTGPTDSWDAASMTLSGSGSDQNSDKNAYTEIIFEDEEGFTSVTMVHQSILVRGFNAILDLKGKVMCAKPPKAPEISAECEMKTKDLPKDKVAVTAVVSATIAGVLNIDAEFVNVVFKVIGSVVKVSFTVTKPFMSRSAATKISNDIREASFAAACKDLLHKKATIFGLPLTVTALHVDTSSVSLTIPEVGYGSGWVEPTYPVSTPAGTHGFKLPIKPVILIDVPISLSRGFTAKSLLASLHVAFVAVFALSGFTGHFDISLGSLLSGGRRLGDLVSGDTQVEVVVIEPNSELQAAAVDAWFKGNIVKAIEYESDLNGKVTAETPKITQNMDDEPHGLYSGKGWHTVCRQSAADDSVDAMGSAIEEVAEMSVLECSEKCNQMGKGCKGFEYRKRKARCELHTRDICHVMEQNPDWFKHDHDFQCFVKCS